MTGIGFLRSETSGDFENFPVYKLVDEVSGFCYDYYGVNCHAICTSAFNTSEIVIVNSDSTTGVSVAMCPPNYLVSSCGIDLSQTSYEEFPYSLPNGNGSCTCYSYYEHVCQAVCLIKDKVNFQETYLINEVTSTGVIQAYCPDNSYVLGCGYKGQDSDSDEHEDYWYVYPEKKYCVCYNYYDVTCVAICANVFLLGQPNCTGCANEKCDSSGCSECLNDFYLENNQCYLKPCFQTCNNCTTEDECEKCSDCTQCTTEDCQTCIEENIVNLGCMPCAYNYYLNDDGYCTKCSVETDPNKYRKGLNDGTGRCLNCSTTFDHFLVCTTDMAACGICLNQSLVELEASVVQTSTTNIASFNSHINFDFVMFLFLGSLLLNLFYEGKN